MLRSFVNVVPLAFNVHFIIPNLRSVCLSYVDNDINANFPSHRARMQGLVHTPCILVM